MEQVPARHVAMLTATDNKRAVSLQYKVFSPCSSLAFQALTNCSTQ